MNKQLTDYVRTQLEAGVSREDITRALKSEGGWTEEEIDKALKIVEGDLGNTSSADQEQPETRTENITSSQASSSAPLLVGVVVLLFVGGIAGAAYFRNHIPFLNFSERPPEDLLERIGQAYKELDSFSFSTQADITTEGPMSYFDPLAKEDPSELVSMDYSVNIDGGFDVSDVNSITATMNASMETSTSENFKAGSNDFDSELAIRFIDNTLYINLAKAPNIGFFSLSPFENQWISIDPESSEEFGYSISEEELDKNVEEVIAQAMEVAGQLKEINAEHGGFEVAYEGTERIEGDSSYHFAIGINKENIYDTLVAISEEFSVEGEEVNYPPRSELEEMLKPVENVSLDVYVSKSNYLVTKESLSAEYSDDEEASGTMNVTTTYSNFNEPLNVEAPEDARSFEDVLNEMFGPMMNSQMNTGVNQGDGSDSFEIDS
ncbi:MAG: DUF6612 family protein [Candidatus Campbellbacteria bacterium]|nr:DUF6612 family protein [Candidatus Campbellbacteria bacterium]